MDKGQITIILVVVAFIGMILGSRFLSNIVRKKTINELESRYGMPLIKCYFNNWGYTFICGITGMTTLICSTILINALIENTWEPEIIFAIIMGASFAILYIVFFIITVNSITFVYSNRIIHRSLFGKEFKEYNFCELRAFVFPMIAGRGGSNLTMHFTNGVISANSQECGTYDLHAFLQKGYSHLEGYEMISKFYNS